MKDWTWTGWDAFKCFLLGLAMGVYLTATVFNGRVSRGEIDAMADLDRCHGRLLVADNRCQERINVVRKAAIEITKNLRVEARGVAQ